MKIKIIYNKKLKNYFLIVNGIIDDYKIKVLTGANGDLSNASILRIQQSTKWISFNSLLIEEQIEITKLVGNYLIHKSEELRQIKQKIYSEID